MLYLDFVMVHLDYDFWGGLTFYSLDTLRYNKCFQITMSVVIQAVYALKIKLVHLKTIFFYYEIMCREII
jgi:hypothetical protein